MIKACEDKLKEIDNTLHNAGNTEELLRKLVMLYGEILHTFIEDDPLATKALTQLKIKPADLTAARDGKGKSQGINTVLELAKKMTFDDVTISAKAIRELANGYGRHALEDEHTAKQLGAGDSASESYVDAAMWYYRQAIILYCGTGLGGKQPAPKTGSQWLDYARALDSAADALVNATQNEDPTDYAEIIAENLVANLLYKEAKSVFDDLQKFVKAGTLQDPSGLIKDGQTVSAKGFTSTDTNLTNFQK